MTRQESFADKALQWKLAAEEKAKATKETPKEEEEAAEKEDDEVGDETAEKRDLAKARKFKRMSDAGAIPDHIYEALEKAKTRSSAQTALINQLFEKNGRGKLTMKLEKPVFEVTKSAKHQKYGKDETIGVPRNVMLHRDFRGDELALSASIAKGTVLVWMQDGVEFAGYRQTVAGIGKKVDEKTRSRVALKPT